MTSSTAKRLVLGLSVLCAAVALTGAAGAQSKPSVKPGLWEYTYRAFGLIPAGKEKRCIKPADMEKFFSGPCNHNYTCTYPTKVIGDGKITLKGKWVDKRGREAPVSATGTYSDTALDLRAVVDPIGAIPTITVTSSSKWLGPDCPAGTEGA